MRMRRGRVLGLILVLASLSAVSARQAPSEPAPASSAYMPTATIKELMLHVIDPSADVVWEAVAVIETLDGLEERAPESEDEWLAVRRGAIQLLESSNLLLVPGRRVAAPGAISEAPGVELEPEEIDALIA